MYEAYAYVSLVQYLMYQSKEDNKSNARAVRIATKEVYVREPSLFCFFGLKDGGSCLNRLFRSYRNNCLPSYTCLGYLWGCVTNSMMSLQKLRLLCTSLKILYFDYANFFVLIKPKYTLYVKNSLLEYCTHTSKTYLGMFQSDDPCYFDRQKSNIFFQY